MEVDEARAKPNSQTRHKRWWLFLFIALVSLLIVVIAALAAQLYSKSSAQIPETIAQKISFPIYLPSQLPGNFKIVEGSFSIQDGDTLMFEATDSTGATIAFAEQKRQPNFNFTNFHTSQIKEPKILNDVPFPSVTGKANIGQTRVLSVVADGTWIFVSTLAPLSEEDMRTIATGLRHNN